MSFKEWLAKHRKRTSPLGDFARDAEVDGAVTKLENTQQAWSNHLRSCNACKEALQTLDKAWTYYERALKREAQQGKG